LSSASLSPPQAPKRSADKKVHEPSASTKRPLKDRFPISGLIRRWWPQASQITITR
jgi:hypothetical protein